MNRRRQIVAAGALLAAISGCRSDDKAVAEPPVIELPVTLPDREPPTVDARIVKLDDTTARLQGTVTDNVQVTSVLVSYELIGGSFFVSDTVHFVPAKSVAIDIALRSRPFGPTRIRLVTRDSVKNLNVWTNSWWPAPPPPPPRFTIDSISSAGDPIAAPGFVVSTTVVGPAPIQSMYIMIDEGESNAQRVDVPSIRIQRTISPSAGEAHLPVIIEGPLANGRHSFHLVMLDSAGTTRDTTFSRTVNVPDVVYDVRHLAGLSGGETRGVDLNARGDVAGVEIVANVARAMLWRAGQAPTLLSTPGTDPSAPSGMNDQGDVVGLARIGGVDTGVHWDANGDFGVIRYDADKRLAMTLDITNDRAAFGFASGSPDGVVAVDVDAGTVTRYSIFRLPFAVNERRQFLYRSSDGGYTFNFAAFGTSFAFPPLRAGAGDRFGRGYSADPVGIDALGNVVGILEGEPFISEQGKPRYLTGQVPGKPAHVSPRGEIVSVAGAQIFIWNRTSGTRHVVVRDDAWTIDVVIRLNDRGDILARGVSKTGQRGALLLTPTFAVTPQ